MENTGCKTCPGIYGSIDIDPTATACELSGRGRDGRDGRSNCGGGRTENKTSTVLRPRDDDRRARGREGAGARQPAIQTRVIQPSITPSTPVRTPAPEQIQGKGDGVPATAKQPVPPPAPKPVVQAAVTDVPTITASANTPAPATTANGGKGLVPGSPEYCAQFPETELCRQGKAPPPPSPATRIYCGDPGAHPELCTPRPVSTSQPAPAPTSAIVSKSAAPAASSETVKAAGSVSGTLDECLIDFANMTPERQIATIQGSGPLATYTTSSEAIVGIRAGRNGAASSFANFMRTFRMGSPEITAFCASVNRAIAPSGRVDSTGFAIGQSASVAPWDARYSIPSSMMPAGSPGGCIAPPAPAGAAVQGGAQWWNNNGYAEQIPGFAPAGIAPAGFFASPRTLLPRDPFTVNGAPDGTHVYQMDRSGTSIGGGRDGFSRGGSAFVYFQRNEPSAVYARSPSGELRVAFGAPNASIHWSQMAPVVASYGEARPAYEAGPARRDPQVPNVAFLNASSADIKNASQEGTFISPTYAAKGFKGAGSVLGYNPLWWTQQGLPEQIPGFAPAGAVMDHDGYLDVFVQLPAEAQANVLTSLAFGQGEVRDPYAHFLAGLLRRGELMFNGEAVTDLAVSHIKNFANRAQAPSARGLIDLAIMQEGTAYGFVAPSNNGFAPAGNAAPQANQPPPGFTPEQWGALLAQNPEVAARLWTEFQQRPSTFSQVSGSIMQAANVVLSQLNASRAAALEERRADFAHQQAMARIQIDRENAAAARLAAQPQQPMMSISAPLEQPPAAPPVQQPPAAPPVQQPPADPASMSTGTMAAIGLGVVAVGGGGLYLATRSRGSRSARSNGFLDGLFGKSKGGKKSSKKAR